MARRSISPIRTPTKSENDPRDNMIRKLKEDLIIARGRQKELAILENYLVELIQKTKLLSAETVKTEEEGKIKLELTNKSINQLKRQVENLRAELRSTHTELGEVEEEQSNIKKLLNSKVIQIEKLKKQGTFLHEENQKLLNQHYRLRAQEDEINHEIRKLSETIRDSESRLSEINRKVLEVKTYINEMSDENHLFKEKLKQYEHENTDIGNDLEQKENRIDSLEKVFTDKHEEIKNKVEGYIELEHQHQKNMKETKHKANLIKIQNDKFNELNNVIKKLEKTIAEREKETNKIVNQSDEIHKANQDLVNIIGKEKVDLAMCQEHLQNLLKHNALIQEEMENHLKEDELIMNGLKRKKILPSVDNLRSLRTSRNQYKNTNRTYL